METLERLKGLSGRDLAMLGVHAVAYVKPVTVDGQMVFAIHSADGREIALIADREIALETIRQNNLEPVSVH